MINIARGSHSSPAAKTLWTEYEKKRRTLTRAARANDIIYRYYFRLKYRLFVNRSDRFVDNDAENTFGFTRSIHEIITIKIFLIKF